MAEEAKEEEPEAKSGGVLGKIILVLGVVLVAAIGGLSTYLFVLKPMLEKAAAELVASEQESDGDPIPLMPVEIEFPQTAVNVMREGQAPAATLLFGVTLECENAATAELVNRHQARFVDMINKLHDSRTRSELDDVLLIKESIQRQALQKANEILMRLQDTSADTVRITSVLHHTFVVQDPL